MSELSPAAQAVLNKAFSAYDEEVLYVSPAEKHAGMVAAAALRAAAIYSYCPVDRKRLAAIADELEAQ